MTKPLNLFSNVRGDVFGGITAAVVALPLALAFGVASGAGPIAGLYGAVAVGFFAALFGGTPAQVSGPTGPMSVVMAGIILMYAQDPAMAFTVVMLGGVFQILFGVFGLGRYITYMPYPVISGFMSGIGVIIIALQLAPFAGHETAGSVLAALVQLPLAYSAPNFTALGVGTAGLAVMIFMPQKLCSYVPPPLAALGVGLMAGYMWPGSLPLLGEIPQGLPAIHMPVFTLEALPGMLSNAIMLALLGSIDSLLTSLVADNFTRTQHRSDRELVGQGIGNMVAGLIGGLPGAGATMRTVVNIRGGGRGPLSGMVHAVILLACIFGLGGVAGHIPHAILAAILLKVGWDIIDWSFIKRLMRAGVKGADRQAAFVMIAVLLLTVFVDLIMAVAIGVIIKSLITARRLATHQIEDVLFMSAGGKSGRRHALSEREEALLDKAGDALLLLRFTGPLSFGTARDLSSRLHTAYEDYRALVVDLSDTRMMDASIMMTLADMIERAREQGVCIYVGGVDNPVYGMLKSHGALDGVEDAHMFVQREDALVAAVEAL
ncbi:MAG: SulP family inorganic anion transporter [Alphaproteobacteria bacterium]|nr:SulP family inorganic anion transporter [Alphaproteobacteria bacterium]